LEVISTANAEADTNTEQTANHSKDHQSFQGPDLLFIGQVNVDMLFPENDVTNYSGMGLQLMLR